MKEKKIITPVLMILIMIAVMFIPELNAQEEKAPAKTIPDEVKTALMQGMETREARMDIPFSISDYYYLPASQNLYFILLFNAKNADLGYTPLAPIQTEEEEEQQAFVEKSPDVLQSRFDVFLLFDQINGDYTKEVFIPAGFQVNQNAYDPEKEEMYSTGYILPPGKYLLAMAIAQNNNQKIGTQYFEFELIDPANVGDTLAVAPVFFIDDTQKMDGAENRTFVHKGFFTYSILKIKPVLNNTFHSGDACEVFFYVMGGSPDSNTQRYDYTVNYQVLKEGQEEPMIRFAEGNYTSPIIPQPLTFERTVLIQKKKGDEVIEEKKEARDLEPGTYILRLDIKDNISGKTVTKDVEINIE